MRGPLGNHGPLRKPFRHESSFDLASMWNLKPRSELHRCEASHFSGTVTCRDSQSLPFSAAGAPPGRSLFPSPSSRVTGEALLDETPLLTTAHPHAVDFHLMEETQRWRA